VNVLVLNVAGLTINVPWDRQEPPSKDEEDAIKQRLLEDLRKQKADSADPATVKYDHSISVDSRDLDELIRKLDSPILWGHRPDRMREATPEEREIFEKAIGHPFASLRVPVDGIPMHMRDGKLVNIETLRIEMHPGNHMTIETEVPPVRLWSEECRWPQGTFDDVIAKMAQNAGPTLADSAAKFTDHPYRSDVTLQEVIADSVAVQRRLNERLRLYEEASQESRRENERLRSDLAKIRFAGNSANAIAIWMQKVAAHAMEPEKWPDPGKQPTT